MKYFFVFLTLFSFKLSPGSETEAFRGEWSNCRKDSDKTISIYSSIFLNKTRYEVLLFSNEATCEKAILKPLAATLIKSNYTIQDGKIENQMTDYSLIFYKSYFREKFPNVKLCKAPVSQLFQRTECFNNNLGEFKDAIEVIVKDRNKKPQPIYQKGFGQIHEEESISRSDLFTTNIFNLSNLQDN